VMVAGTANLHWWCAKCGDVWSTARGSDSKQTNRNMPFTRRPSDGHKHD
jgi:hypothetical protein